MTRPKNKTAPPGPSAALVSRIDHLTALLWNLPALDWPLVRGVGGSKPQFKSMFAPHAGPEPAVLNPDLTSSITESEVGIEFENQEPL